MVDTKEQYEEYVAKGVQRNREAVKTYRAISNALGASANMMRGQIELALIAGWVAMFLANNHSGNFLTLLVALLALGFNQFQFEWEATVTRNAADEVDKYVCKDTIPSERPKWEKVGSTWGRSVDYLNNLLLIVAILMFMCDIGLGQFILQIFCVTK